MKARNVRFDAYRYPAPGVSQLPRAGGIPEGRTRRRCCDLRGRREGSRGILGSLRVQALMVQAMGPRTRVDTAAREVVYRRHPERLGQLSRPPSRFAAAQQGGTDLG